MFRCLTGTAGLFFCSALLVAQQIGQPAPKGVPARSSPADYTAHISAGGLTYAASLVPADQVKHIFAFDISKNYVVFEVAVYPEASAQADLDPENFIVRSSPSGDSVRPTDSVTVASVIQQKNLPPLPSRTPPVTVATQVGYETGTDPYTGRRVHGTYTSTEVGVAGADNGVGAGPQRLPSPGGYPQDRELLENQLSDKSLPAEKVQHATAGYLYFTSSSLKKKADGVYELEYLSSSQEPVLNGASSSSQKVQLRIPAKTR